MNNTTIKSITFLVLTILVLLPVTYSSYKEYFKNQGKFSNSKIAFVSKYSSLFAILEIVITAIIALSLYYYLKSYFIK
jgi:hypothetical protein